MCNILLSCSVKLEGQPPTTLQIIGHVVERSLELLTLDTEDVVQTINFGSTYYGTDRMESFLIYNNGPDVANFVVILEEGGEGQEVVCIYFIFITDCNTFIVMLVSRNRPFSKMAAANSY